MAAGARYEPRPVFQSYGAYTRGLSQLNVSFLQSARAPETVLFDAASIDSRYPLHDDALSLPVLLTGYEARGTVGRFARFERRSTPVPLRWDWQGETTLSPSRAWAVQPARGLLWATIELSTTWEGRLMALVFKLPPVIVDVTTADGSPEEHRLMPAVASAGVPLSPLVVTAEEMVALARWEWPAPKRDVRSIRLREGWGLGARPGSACAPVAFDNTTARCGLESVAAVERRC